MESSLALSMRSLNLNFRNAFQCISKWYVNLFLIVLRASPAVHDAIGQDIGQQGANQL